MKKNLPTLKEFTFINFAIVLVAIGIYFFKTPNGFAIGGVSGLSIILANLFPILTPATYMLIINVCLLIIGVIVLGKKCGFLTIYCSMMLSIGTWILEQVCPLSSPLTTYPLLELVYAVLLNGIGMAILFKCKASSGGTDIVALILKKYTSMNVGTALLCTDFAIAAATFVRFGADGRISIDAQTGLFCILGLFAKVFVVDDIIDSMNLCKAFTIITTKPTEVNKYITDEIHHSATMYSAKGAYTGEDRTVIVTVCRRVEAIKLRRYVHRIDPHAFIIITKTSEIMGKGFRDNIN
ncbi:MAG: YitT family protein [Clostridia bacterium]|nr:YitT family protein [Clostridia bacterium]